MRNNRFRFKKVMVRNEKNVAGMDISERGATIGATTNVEVGRKT